MQDVSVSHILEEKSGLVLKRLRCMCPWIGKRLRLILSNSTSGFLSPVSPVWTSRHCFSMSCAPLPHHYLPRNCSCDWQSDLQNGLIKKIPVCVAKGGCTSLWPMALLNGRCYSACHDRSPHPMPVPANYIFRSYATTTEMLTWYLMAVPVVCLLRTRLIRGELAVT